MIFENHPIGCQTVNIWCFDFRLAVESNVVVSQIIGNNKNDIWLGGVFLSLKQKGTKKNQY
jgi:hypothetical protein